MPDIISLLTELGFGEYEARAYIALLERSPLNGYELAKHSGVPRGNVYAVLEKLEERGAVMRMEAEGATRYTAVPSHELLARLRGRLGETLDRAESALNTVAAPVAEEPVWNLRGYDALIEHARGQVASAENELLLAVWPEEARALAGVIADARRRSVHLNTLCLAGCPHECGACQGHVFRYPIAPRDDLRWLIVVPDNREALAGGIRPGAARGEPDSAEALRTRQRLLVDLISAYIRHSVALAAVLADLGPGLEASLGADTQAALAAISPAGSPGTWLAQLRALLAEGPQEANHAS